MMKEIQKLDYERYLALIFAPREARAHMQAIIMYNVELARIRSRVTEAVAGHIRIVWWKEALDELFDPARKARRHAVVQLLEDAVNAHPAIAKETLSEMVDARAKDLDEWPFENMQQFREYLVATSYNVSKCFIDILYPQAGREAHNAAKELSYAWAVCAILRSAQRNFGAGRSVFPLDLMNQHKLRLDNYGKPEFLEASRAVVKQLIESAEEALQSGQEAMKHMSDEERRALKPVLLQATLAQHNIRQIKRNKYDVLGRGINPHLGMFSLLKIYSGR